MWISVSEHDVEAPQLDVLVCGTAASRGVRACLASESPRPHVLLTEAWGISQPGSRVD